MRILIVSAETARTKNHSTYLRIRYAEEDKVQRNAVLFGARKGGGDEPPAFEPKDIVGKVCEAEVEKGEPSNKILSLQIVPGANATPFIRTTKLDVPSMMRDLREWTRNAGDATKVVDEVLFGSKGRMDAFSKWPAAKMNHHAFQGGLLEHTWAMASMANALAKSDPALENIDHGVVMTAIVLHDLAKVFTYKFDGGVEKNNLEVLLGHIVIADELVIKACVKLGLSSADGQILNLRHCLLSHHGKREWGAVVVPSTREAILVHQIDLMQANNEMAREGLSEIGKGERSNRISALETEMVNV